jgi:DNA repair photolyase
MEKVYKSALGVRGDSLYCPLAFSLDSYFNCLVDCWHCYLRRLNATWGMDLRPADPEAVDRQLSNGLKNRNPQTPLAYCLTQKKTIRLGNKADPFQPAELTHGVSGRLLRVLFKHRWTYVIQTRFTANLLPYESTLVRSAQYGLVKIMPVISPGWDKDWVLFERSRTTHPDERVHHIQAFQKKGIPCGVNGEPFIPGFHTLQDFERVIVFLKNHGITSYNTYNFHFNAFVARRIHENCPGVDIERIWYYNQDQQWRPILQKLIDIAKKYNMNLGCPDFVNSGKDYREPANTCCGLDVPNPCRFNTHNFKALAQDGTTAEEIISLTWDGTGDKSTGEKIIRGQKADFYTLKDAGF